MAISSQNPVAQTITFVVVMKLKSLPPDKGGETEGG